MPAARLPLLYYAYAMGTTLGAPLIHHQQKRKLLAAGVDPMRIRERMGHATRPRPPGRLIWFHAVSVGEFLSILGLIQNLRSQSVPPQILVTTTTITSAEMAAKRLPQGVIHQYAALDTPGATRRFLKHWRPELAVFVESELWPRQIVETHKRGIPLALINARLSKRSLKRWQSAAKTAKSLLSRFSRILCQTEDTRLAVIDLGMPATTTATSGDLKASSDPLPFDNTALARLQQIVGTRPLWVAASTHLDEEELIAAAHRLAQERHSDSLLILAPRHPERAEVIEKMLKLQGFRVARRSKGEQIDLTTEIYLADTLGEMGMWYALAPIVFVGGSFTDVGGHNPYEPAHANCAILHGPKVVNFQQAYDDMAAQWACLQVRNDVDLGQQLADLFDSEDRHSLAKAALGYVENTRNIRQDVAKELLTLLPN